MKTRTSCLLVSMLLALLSAAAAQAAPMPDGLAIRKVDRVPAYSTNTYYLPMLAGETARLVLNGDGDTDLDVYVYDVFGNLIVFDEGVTDFAALEWTCTLSSTFTIMVKNHGLVYNDFVMVID